MTPSLKFFKIIISYPYKEINLKIDGNKTIEEAGLNFCSLVQKSD